MSNRSGNMQGGDQLFQNMDEQEAVYAPQQLPGGDQRADADGDVADVAGIDTVSIPAVTAGNITGTSAGGVGAGTGAAPIASAVPVRRDLADSSSTDRG